MPNCPAFNALIAASLCSLSSCSTEEDFDLSDMDAGKGGVMRADASLDAMARSSSDGSSSDGISSSGSCAAPDDSGRSACNGRSILSDSVVNARDLGGTPLENGARVAYGTLFRGPPLSALSPDDCTAFAQLGIRTVIDLRIPSERERKLNASCVTQTAQIRLAPLPVPYSVSPTDYIADLDTTDSIAEVFRALGDEAAYPIYFHCTWGRDRTGVLAAVLLRTLGATRADIMQEYLLSESNVGAYPDSLAAVLDELERRGGIDAYLAAAGIPPNAVATLRARASTR